MFIIDGKYFLFAIAIGLDFLRVDGIISNKFLKSERDKSDGDQREDNEISQSVDRDYIAEFRNHYNSREGLSEHNDKHFKGGFEDYEGFQSENYHGHFGHGGGGHYGDGHLLHHHHYHDHHKPHNEIGYHKALAIKSLLVPLAGVALLGAAAAFISNPILLQLGVISSGPLGRKKRNAAEEQSISIEDEIRSNRIKLLKNFMAKVPVEKIRSQEKRWLADYLSCSRMSNNKFCIERLACELYSPEGQTMAVEAEVLTVVVNEILNNDFIPKGTKVEILHAIETGKNNSTCDKFFCSQLENPTNTYKSQSVSYN